MIVGLSRERFGVEIALQLWNELQKKPVGEGMRHSHRDYCGIGLLKTESGVGLFEICDGDGFQKVHWTHIDSFVRYWAEQSDHGLCGADPEHPELLTDSAFKLNNQRIHRKWVCELLEQSAARRVADGQGCRGVEKCPTSESPRVVKRHPAPFGLRWWRAYMDR